MRFWGLSLFGLLQGSPLQERPAAARDYAIYNLVLDSLSEGANRGNSLIVNRTVTRDPSFRRTVLRMTPKAYPDTALVDSLASGVEAFTPHVLDSTPLGPGVRFISDTVFRSLFRRDPSSGWAALRARYAGASAVIELSNIGYHPSGDTAVVYAAVKCGRLCGRGGLYFLARTGGKWMITSIDMHWVS